MKLILRTILLSFCFFLTDGSHLAHSNSLKANTTLSVQFQDIDAPGGLSASTNLPERDHATFRATRPEYESTEYLCVVEEVVDYRIESANPTDEFSTDNYFAAYYARAIEFLCLYLHSPFAANDLLTYASTSRFIFFRVIRI